MSSPIAFDAVPVPPHDGLTNAPPGLAAQATALDANFAKVNTYLPGVWHSSTNQTRMPTGVSTFVANQWVPFGESVWPSVEIALSNQIPAILVSIQTEITWNGGYIVVGVMGYSGFAPGGTRWLRSAVYGPWATASANGYATIHNWYPATGTLRLTPIYHAPNTVDGAVLYGQMTVTAMG